MRKIKNPSRRCNICIIGVPRMKKRENNRESGQRNKLKIILITDFQIESLTKMPSTGNENTAKPSNINENVKMLKIKKKSKSFHTQKGRKRAGYVPRIRKQIRFRFINSTTRSLKKRK